MPIATKTERQPYRHAIVGQSNKLPDETQKVSPPCKPFPFFKLVKQWSTTPRTTSTQPSLPMYLNLEDNHTDLSPACYIPESLGRLILREEINALSTSGDDKSKAMLQYWCEEDGLEGLVKPLKLDRRCWVVPPEVVAQHVECLAEHVECLKGMLEDLEYMLLSLAIIPCRQVGSFTYANPYFFAEYTMRMVHIRGMSRGGSCGEFLSIVLSS
ncbi:hypothetical protein QFC22_005678 [Naganishia vaughanmartiniae]|uniref:Uncharacterized protein n=1 Tax=Naganishia vaughanmartiniae TaxID=1424756 RepID=A0ACC2WSZ8_9TREE|nr:hypothetical protein QFC22_005678 [Naganishia vaughanmartiniae]